ncbi:MAG: phage scaffolding protein [Clostridiales bacterium]|nr:phage scaffolding protein [Clostridiales bacterium]
MKTEELKTQGLTDDQIAFVMAENGKDLKKLQRENETLTHDRDTWKGKAETAESTLKNFEGIDPAKLQQELDSWKEKARQAEEDAKNQLQERDFNDALRDALDQITFSSEAAKRDVTAQIRAAGLKLDNGRILGLNDLVEQIREKDASAFVDEQQQQAQQNAARFTAPAGKRGAPGGTDTADENQMRSWFGLSPKK